VANEYPVILYRRDDGELEKRVVIPESVFTEMTSAEAMAKQARAAGFWTRLRRWFGQKTDEAPDEQTTEIGGVPVADVGGSLAEEETARRDETTRLARYRDYIRMDEDCVELGRALTVTARNVFMSKEGDEESYKVVADNPSIQKMLDDLDDRIDLPEAMPGICRSALLYGDEFEEVVAEERTNLVVRLKWLDPEMTTRNEDEYGRLIAKAAFTVKTEGEMDGVPLHAWQVIHLRHAHQRGARYGRSFLFHARRPWRLLEPMEDNVVNTRYTRSSDILAVTIPLPPNCTSDEAERIVSKFIRKLKKRRVVDSNGKVDWRRAPLPDSADIVIGQPSGENVAKATIQRLGVSGALGEVTDVKYFQRKLLTATGVPPSYLGIEESVNAKATLSWEDLNFAREIRAIQKEMAWFQRQLYNRQIVLLGGAPEKDLYRIVYPAISMVDEELKMSVEQMRWTIFGQARGSGIPVRWLLRRIIGLSEEDVEELYAMGLRDEPGTSEKPPVGAEEHARDRVFRDMRLANDIQTLRDMIRVIRRERLNRPLEA